MSQGPQAVVDAYFNGINEERFEDLGDLFAPGAELRAPGIDLTSGREAIVGYFQAAIKPYVEHRDQPSRTIVAGSTATVEVHFRGVLSSGFTLEFEAVDIFDLAPDGRITTLSSWYDSHEVRERLRAARQSSAN